jgi:(+)-neomenthol dehydrogenase
MAEKILTPQKRCAVVTGGNKGIGFEICRQLALNGIKVVLTARDEIKGKKAVQELQESGLSDLIFHQLDVKDSSSIDSLAKFVKTHLNKLDILVNNAGESGIILDAEAFSSFKEGAGFMEVNDENADLLTGIIEQSYEMAEECVKTNYYGTKQVTESLLPCLQLSNSARIVNISSNYGELSCIPNEKIRAELQNIDSLTVEKVEKILEEFLRDFKEDKLKVNSWPITVSAYKVSKVSMNAYTRLLAKKFPKMVINCVHPGYVVTDITCKTGLITPEEGARAPVMVALLPDGSPSGVYFRQMEVSSF